MTPSSTTTPRVSTPVKLYLLATMPFVVASGIIPVDLYFTGREYWSGGPGTAVALGASGLLAYAIAALLIRAAALLGPAPPRYLAAFLFCSGAFVLVSDVYFPPQTGPMDGSVLSAAEPPLQVLAEAVIFVACAGLFFALARGKLVTAAAAFSGAMVLVAVSYAAVAWSAVPDAGAASGTPAHPGRRAEAAGTTAPGNVYHVVLDEMQTDAFVLAIKEDDLARHFTGFTFYPYNIANYLATAHSRPSYLTGQFYHSGKLEKWARSWADRSLLRHLADQGFRISMYGPQRTWSSGDVDELVLSRDTYEEEVGVLDPEVADFLQIWLVRLAPTALRAEALSFWQDARQRLRRALAPAGTAFPVATEEGTAPYSSALMLRRLAGDEEGRAPRGEYVYAHALLPHHPFVMGRDCSYRQGHDARSTEAYLAQAGCAAKLVVAFLDELKRLGRYDAATIVVHGDHGGLYGGFFTEPEPSTRPAAGAGGVRTGGGAATPGWPADSGPDAATWRMFKEQVAKNGVQLASRTRALLMIKPPFAEGDLRVSDLPSQLVDIFPTVLDILSLEPPGHELHGRSLLRPDAGARREARFGMIRKKISKKLIEVRLEDQRDFWSSGLTPIGPATEPRLWRKELR